MGIPCNAAVGSVFAVDTLKTVNRASDKEVYVAGKYGANAIDYLISKRFRKRNAIEYSNKDILSHMYVGGLFSYDMFAPRYDYNYDGGSSWGMLLGKELNRTHAVELLFMYGSNAQSYSRALLERYALQLNHRFNFSRYFFGYNPQRFYEISSSLGAGVQFSSIWDKDYTSPYLYFGIQNSFRLGRRVNLVVEPHLAIGGDGYNGAPSDNWYSGYNLSYGAMASLRYTLKDETPAESDSLLFSRNYMFVSAGLQSLNADINFHRTLGPSLTVGYGRWLAQRVALQLSAGYSAGGWDAYDVQDGDNEHSHLLYSKTQYLYGRLEGVFNVFSSFADIERAARGFSANLSLGYEYGRMWKYKTALANQIVDNYSGFTGAVRLRGHVGEGKVLFLEPRVTLANYDKAYLPYRDTKRNEVDTRYALAVGIEYGNPYISSAAPEGIAYEPRMAVSVSGGTGYIFNRGSYAGGSLMDGIAGVSFEYQPHRLFGARVQFDYGLYNLSDKSAYTETTADGVSLGRSGLWHKTYHTISGILDAKFDLSNALWGYDPSRRWNTALYAGPVFSRHRSIDASIDAREELAEGSNVSIGSRVSEDNHWGAHLAFNTRYSLTERLGVFGELDLRMYANDYLGSENLDYNPVRVFGARVGVDYDINLPNIIADAKTESAVPDDYMFVSAGLQSLNSDINFHRTLGPALTLGYGHWFARRFGVQLSGGYSAGGWLGLKQRVGDGGSDHTLYSKSQYVFGRAEGILNLYSSHGVRFGASRGFSANLLAGYEFGRLWKYVTTLENQMVDNYSGFTGGIRFRGHVGEGKVLFFEPRVTFANYEQPSTAGRVDPSRLDSRYTLAVGMEYGNPYKYSSRPEGITYEPRMAVAVSGGTGYVFNRGAYADGSLMDGVAGISFEYQPHRLFGARIGVDYGLSNFSDKERYSVTTGADKVNREGLWHKTYHTISGVLDVKFDLSNALWGYDPSRRWNTALYAGPVVSRHRRIDSSLDALEQSELPDGASVSMNRRVSEDNYWGAHLGFNTRYSLTGRLGLFGELDLRVYDNEYLGSELTLDFNPVRHIGARVGVDYDINLPKIVSDAKSESAVPDDYMFVSAGLQSLNSDINFHRTLGPALTLGYGHWFARRFGVQLSGGYSAGGWLGLKQRVGDGGSDHTLYSKSQYVFGRAEGILNLYSSHGVRFGASRGFSANLLAGYEFGRLWKYVTTLENQMVDNYSGFTGGIRFRGHVGEGKVLFFEPRVTFANYEQPSTAGRVDPSRLDSRYTLAVGMEYGNPYKYSSRPEGITYEPRMAVAVSGGTGYVFNRGAYADGSLMDGVAGISFEYQPHRLFGARIGVDYGLSNFSDKERYSVTTGADKVNREGLWHKTYHTISGVLDVKFDLSNALWGYDPSRRWNTALYAGPVVSRHRRIDSSLDALEQSELPDGASVSMNRRVSEDNYWGAHLGFNTRYSLTGRLGLFGELDLRVYDNEYLGSEMTLDFNPVRHIGARVGISFDLK